MVSVSQDFVPEPHHVPFDDIVVWDNFCHEQAMHVHSDLQIHMVHVPGDRLLHFWHDIDVGVAHVSWLLGLRSGKSF